MIPLPLRGALTLEKCFPGATDAASKMNESWKSWGGQHGVSVRPRRHPAWAWGVAYQIGHGVTWSVQGPLSLVGGMGLLLISLIKTCEVSQAPLGLLTQRCELTG